MDISQIDDLAVEVDSQKVINQVPSTWHPQYGIHVGWSMGALFLMVIILGCMAFATESGLLFWSVSLATAVFVTSLIYPGLIVNSIQITKTIPDSGIVSQPLAITYTIRNTRKYFPIYSLRLVEIFDKNLLSGVPRIYIPYIGAGESCSIQILIIPSKRGQLTCLGTRLASKYPFGLLTRFLTVLDKRSIMIYPALGNLARPAIPANRQTDYQLGLTQPRYQGSSDEFYALREYHPGDNPRHIHWKRSARMGRLVVREMSQYSPNRLTVILDTFLPENNIRNSFVFEQMVSFTATVLCHSLENGYRAGLICAGVPPLMVPPLAGREAQHRILETLSCVEPQFSSSLSDLFRNWRFTSAWRGRCLIISFSKPGSNIQGKLSEVIGPVQLFVAGNAEWRNIFIPPSCLKSEELSGDV